MLDRESYEGATALIAAYGIAAFAEATGRAEASRRRDNPFMFARWCGVRRAIRLLADPEAAGTLH